ncbi:hypothetical protein BC629DRAFT_1472143 [Irpex lacteus]|nr:hypothetical protein BC629DRAFT_1472143 [Irpex lacteus]
MKIDHIECQVVCDGEVLTEYQEKLDGEREKSCHIVSETGKTFSVRLRSHPHEFNVSGHLWVDGKCAAAIALRSSQSFDLEGVSIDDTGVKPFVFSSITLTDDDSALSAAGSRSSMKDLGTICMKMCRIKNVRSAKDPKPISCDLDDKPVHEKAKKTGGHRVTLGETLKGKESLTRFVDVDYIDPLDSPYYKFTLRFRDKAMLQAQGIVPHDPAPLPPKRPASSTPSGSSAKRPRIEGSSSQDSSSSQVKLEDTPAARELQARRDALRAQRAAIEAQEAAIEEELRLAGGANVKREASPIVLVGASSGDIIDLTDDD